MEIANKVFIVTGGASGLGAGTVRMLVENGAKVVIADVQDEPGQALAKELGQRYVHCDVTQEADGKSAVAAALELGALVGLVNFAEGRVDQPDRQLQHDAPGRRSHERQYARAHRRTRRDDQHRLGRRV
ncbi:hypothetical protein G6F50_017183 [Rhizopus delemar]|uniref:Uncharacterized protein n=1 Tax=Rhizopus delemar TaxID=936053 RepID=A0A9P6XQQ6_9FUNG|nr:hypothetical protein G6F50_017183 [Rhizopus delemar]